MEIIIGRQVSGENDVAVPKHFENVSRKHAKVRIDHNTVAIEDLGSANGTYVNDVRIIRKLVNATDKVALGDKDGYRINMDDLVERYNAIVLKDKIDFHLEFERLKEIYQEFLIKRNKIKKQSGLRSFIPRIIITLMGIAAVLIIPMSSDSRYIFMTVIGLIGGASALVKGDDLKIQEKIEDLNIAYQNKYLCPKCKRSLGLHHSWKYIRSGKTCPHKCGAVYEKE